MACCGKEICSGCSYAPVYDNRGNEVAEKKCAFCRSPDPESYEKGIERIMKRVEKDDPIAIYTIGNYYKDGRNGYPQDYTKALELWHRAAELGYADAYCCIGYSYEFGRGVKVDKKKAKHNFEQAAMGGDVAARHNVGVSEEKKGNTRKAIKHYTIAVRNGHDVSLDTIQKMYSIGYATKDDYTTALQSYQVYLGEIKSKQRDEAVAADEGYRYY